MSAVETSSAALYVAFVNDRTDWHCLHFNLLEEREEAAAIRRLRRDMKLFIDGLRER